MTVLTLLTLCTAVCIGREAVYAQQDPIVSTKDGMVEGSRRYYNGSMYEEFLGIPFAAPPVGNLRWQPPQPVTPWTGILNAKNYSIHCTQFIAPIYRFIEMGNVSGEDCLYLNVWVPHGIAAHEGQPLPVMVYIYGGIFILGTGEMYPGYDLALHGEVVVVNFNYRLSTIGWMSTGDAAASGNYGLWDAQAALIWVQENIAQFAGDPNRVTVFGQSAGGAMTSHTVISPMMRGMFHGAISVSGTSSGYFGLQRYPLRTAAMIADIFNCTNVQSSYDLVDCLMQEDPHELDFWGVVGHFTEESRITSFLPVVDGQIVPLEPMEAWQLGYGQHVNYIAGFCYDDGANWVLLNQLSFPNIGYSRTWTATNESMWDTMMVVLGATENEVELMQDIIGQYPDLDTTDNYTRTRTMSEALTDWWFAYGPHWEANTHVSYQTRPTYMYQFHHRQSFLVGYPEWVEGTHLDDVYSILGYPFMEVFRERFLRADFNDTDFLVSSNIQDYFTNFAHTGDPNDGPNPPTVHWDEFDPALQNYLDEAPPTFSMKNFETEKTDNYQYWTDFPSKMIYPPDPTFPLPEEDRLTEEDLARAVENLRSFMHVVLSEQPEALAMMDDIIDGFVEARKGRL